VRAVTPGARAIACAAAGTTLLPGPAVAHPGLDLVPGDIWTAWTGDPLVLMVLGAACTLYGLGLRRVWRQAGPGRGVRHWQAACFAGGVFFLFMALVSPLHALGGALFAGHMAQHMVLMNLAAPLLVLGVPHTALAWAIPGDRRRAARLLAAPAVRGTWRVLTVPAVAWLVHAAVIWLWHAPALYSATVASELVHGIQHTSFMVAAVLFWSALRDRAAHGVAVLYLFTTAVHTSILGALLAFAPAPYYAPYALTAPLWGMTALEDQQIGGFIMWIPGGMVYFAAALTLLALWLRRSEQRADRVLRAAGVAKPAALAVVLLVAAATAACRGGAEQRFEVPGADANRGRDAFVAYGCGACHEIRGVRGADGRVGPPLTGVRGRVYIAGYLPNEAGNLAAFIMNPPALRNPTAMPILGLSEQEARDIAAYLYSLR
jgi:putative membrane protein